MSVRKRGKTYQVRVTGFPSQTAPTEEAADKIDLALRVRRSLGDLYEDPAIFEIPAIKHRPRKGRALTVPQLYELASWAPECASRLIVIAGQVGARQQVWFRLTDDVLDLDAGTMTIPAWLAKSRR